MVVVRFFVRQDGRARAQVRGRGHAPELPACVQTLAGAGGPVRVSGKSRRAE